MSANAAKYLLSVSNIGIVTICFAVFLTTLNGGGWGCAKNPNPDRQTWNCGSKDKPSAVKAELINGTLTVRGKGEMRDYDRYDFAPWRGKPYLEYKYQCYVELENGEFVGGHYATNFTIAHVHIEEGVTRIGNEAFAHLVGLKSVTIPASVISIGKDAFAGYGRRPLTVSKDNPKYRSENGILFNKDKTTLIRYPGGNLGSEYTIPNGVTSIGEKAFSHCDGLTSVTIPNTVTVVGDDAFYGCPSLTTVTINDGVAAIGAGMFSGCTKLTSVTIPNSVISIGDAAFFYCTELTSIAIGDGVKHIGGEVFIYCTNLTTVTFPSSVVSIGGDVFLNCHNLQSIICLNPIPPTIKRRTPGETACLYVPKGSINAYHSTDEWKEFKCVKDIATRPQNKIVLRKES